MTRVLALADQSKIGCITQRRFAKVGTKTHPQRGAALDRNGLSVSTETACRFEPKSPVGNSEICNLGGSAPGSCRRGAHGGAFSGANLEPRWGDGDLAHAANSAPRLARLSRVLERLTEELACARIPTSAWNGARRRQSGSMQRRMRVTAGSVSGISTPKQADIIVCDAPGSRTVSNRPPSGSGCIRTR